MKFCASTQMRGDVVPTVDEAFADWSEGQGEVVLDAEHAHGSQHNVNRSGTNETVDEGHPLVSEASPDGGSGARPSSDVKYVSKRPVRPAEVRLPAQAMRSSVISRLTMRRTCRAAASELTLTSSRGPSLSMTCCMVSRICCTRR